MDERTLREHFASLAAYLEKRARHYRENGKTEKAEKAENAASFYRSRALA